MHEPLAGLVALLAQNLQPARLADLIGLIGRVLDPGFQGMHRHAARDLRVLGDVRHDIDVRVAAVRKKVAEDLAATVARRERDPTVIPGETPTAFLPGPTGWCAWRGACWKRRP